MKLERDRPALFTLTLHGYELAALMASARWVVEGAEGELPEEAREQLRRLVEQYDQAAQQLARAERRQ